MERAQGRVETELGTGDPSQGLSDVPCLSGDGHAASARECVRDAAGQARPSRGGTASPDSHSVLASWGPATSRTALRRCERGCARVSGAWRGSASLPASGSLGVMP